MNLTVHHGTEVAPWHSTPPNAQICQGTSILQRPGVTRRVVDEKQPLPKPQGGAQVC